MPPTRDARYTQVGENSGGDPMFERTYGERYYEDIDTTGAAAELAAELGVDLATIEGTGKDGRVTKADVEKAASG
jgi:pyruvate/2-oxoglutarate dehydrogenase complex dihydrolipoamide acyltransferase (E2) component